MFCTNCGTQTAENANFCINCGTAIVGNPSKAANFTKPPNVAAPPTANFHLGNTIMQMHNKRVRFIDNSGDIWEVNLETNSQERITQGSNFISLFFLPFAMDNQNNLWDLRSVPKIVISDLRDLWEGTGFRHRYVNNANEFRLFELLSRGDTTLIKDSVSSISFIHRGGNVVFATDTNGAFSQINLAGDSINIPINGEVERGIVHNELGFLITNNENLLWAWENSQQSATISPFIIMKNVVDVQFVRTPTKEGSIPATVLALTADGSLYAVFENGEFITPALVMKNVRSFTTLHGSVFAITNKNVLYAWGYNGAGQLGDGTTSSRNTPAKILENVASVTPALEYFNGGMIRNTYAITTNGKLWAWGNNRLGQIGDGTTTNHLSPVFVMDNVAYIRPSIGSFGGFAALAILKNGELWSWRENPNNITNTRLSPAFLAHNARMPHGFDFIRWLDTQIF